MHAATHRHSLLAGVIAGLLGGHAAAAPEIEPLRVQLSLTGQPFAGPGCEGGDWSLSWSGELPGETNAIGDLLISYGAFDTTLEEGRADPAPTVNVTPLVCRDEKGKVVLRTTWSGGRGNVRGIVALKHDPAVPSPFFTFDANDIGTCQIDSELMKQVIENNFVVFNSTQLGSLSPPLEVTRDELEQGFTKTYRLEGQVVTSAMMCMGMTLARGELIVSYKSDHRQPSIGLSGCVHLARGLQTTVTATVQPPGGEVRFTADPAATLALQPNGASVTVTGAEPGRATLTGEYTVNGRTATASLPASSIELLSVNGGAAIPKLGIMGADGLPSSRVYRFPIEMNPGDGGDLLVFSVENEGLASAVTSRSELGIQPVREGRTRIQAKTLCGEPVGPPIEIEIATCDDDVRGELTRRQEELERREQELARRITQLVADPEFQRAATEIKETTTTLATKTAELIAATLTVRDARAVKNGTGSALALEQINTAQNLWSGAGIVNDAVAGNDWSATISAVALALDSAGISALKAAVESAMAAQKFGQDLGIIAGVVEELEKLEPQYDEVRRDLYRITERLHRCDKLPPPAPLPPERPTIDDSDIPLPPLPPVPPPNDTLPTEPVPIADADEPSPTPEPTPEEPPAIVDPPDGGPVTAGLCVRPVGEPLRAAELNRALDAASEFATVAERGREIVEGLRATLRAMEATNALGGPEQAEALRALAPQYNAGMNGFLALGEAARAQQARFALCTEQLPEGVAEIATR
jgi:hypothetical protein